MPFVARAPAAPIPIMRRHLGEDFYIVWFQQPGVADTALVDSALRGVGFSGQKVGYLRDLCTRIADGRLELDALEALDDERVIERLRSEWAAWPDPRLETLSVVADGDRAAVEYRI